MSRGAFRNTTRRARKKGGGDKKFKPFALETFRLDPDEETMVRALDFGDGPFVQPRHWVNRKPVICTGNIEVFDGKCVACFHHEEKLAEQKKNGEKLDSPYYAADFYAVELIDFRYHHIIGDPDRGENATKLVDCSHAEAEPKKLRCKYCKSDRDSISERHFGGHKIWEMSRNLWMQFAANNDKIAETCVHVDEEGDVCGNDIFTLGYKCPECETEWMDQDTLDGLDKDELIEFLDDDIACENCDFEGPAEPILECATEAHPATPCEIFDKNVGISCFGEKKRQYNYHVDEDPSSIEVDLEDWGFSEEEVAEMLKMKDMSQKYRPEWIDKSKFNTDEAYVEAVLAKQAERTGLPNPYKGDGPRRSKPFKGRGDKKGGSSFRRPS
jgi:hypothetical protein